MARIARMMIAGEPAVYHVMSRTALDGFPFGDVEKDFFVDLLKRLVFYGGAWVLLHGQPFSPAGADAAGNGFFRPADHVPV